MSTEAKVTITVRKSEKEFNVDLDYDVEGDKVICIRCKVCKCWKTRIKNKKNFSETWVPPGTKCIEKDSLKKHLVSTPHKEANYLSKREKLGREKYTTKVVEETPIGKGFKTNVYR